MKVLITGGTGTFGQAATRFLADAGDTVTIFSRDEQKQELMAEKFKGRENVRFFLGDVRDRDRLQLAMNNHEIVIHAAALKIVPKLEFDPAEAVKTNVLGSMNVISCALEAARHGAARRVVLLSTDKAVNPVNLYGATKKTAEHLFRAANNLGYGGLPKFSAVRYGNVWGSRGSVIEIWERQHAVGLPVTITDPQMTRFFMTAQDAVDLVLRALADMLSPRTPGGGIYLPKLRAYRLDELWEAFSLAHSIEERAVITGIRDGEKTHEALISPYEVPFMKEHGPGHVIGMTRLPERERLDGVCMSSDVAELMTVENLVEHIRGSACCS